MARKLRSALSEDDLQVLSAVLERRGEIRACANCAGLDIGIPPTNIDISLVDFKNTQTYYCRDCDYDGTPIIFDDIASYKKFFYHRRHDYNKGASQLPVNRPSVFAFGRTKAGVHPLYVGVMSLVLPGMGQAYNGERQKGLLLLSAILALFLLSFAIALLADVLDLSLRYDLPAFVLGFYGIIVICSFLDAYIVAYKIRKDRSKVKQR